MTLDNDLWRYALSLYARPGVEQSCLQLQSAGLSINRLLFCLWLGQKSGRSVEAQALTGADDWQQTLTHPVRALRYQVRPLKSEEADTYADCYAALRKAELAAEQVELTLMYQAAQQMPEAVAGPDLVLANLAAYLNACTLKSASETAESLRTLLQAAEVTLPADWNQQLGLIPDQ